MSITAFAPVAAVPMLTAKAVIRSGTAKAGASACGAPRSASLHLFDFEAAARRTG